MLVDVNCHFMLQKARLFELNVLIFVEWSEVTSLLVKKGVLSSRFYQTGGKL